MESFKQGKAGSCLEVRFGFDYIHSKQTNNRGLLKSRNLNLTQLVDQLIKLFQCPFFRGLVRTHLILRVLVPFLAPYWVHSCSILGSVLGPFLFRTQSIGVAVRYQHQVVDSRRISTIVSQLIAGITARSVSRWQIVYITAQSVSQLGCRRISIAIVSFIKGCIKGY